MVHHDADGTGQPLKALWVATYRLISLTLAAVFAAVGLLFALLPGGVLRFFNDFSLSFGLGLSSTEGVTFFLMLAAAYMYVVALLAWFMARKPDNRTFPVLLINAKLASAVLSLIFFFGITHALIYLVNGVVDGLIGAGVFWMYRKQGRFE